jgi:hypothetical protein
VRATVPDVSAFSSRAFCTIDRFLPGRRLRPRVDKRRSRLR